MSILSIFDSISLRRAIPNSENGPPSVHKKHVEDRWELLIDRKKSEQNGHPQNPQNPKTPFP
jgi:hypothetical protein